MTKDELFVLLEEKFLTYKDLKSTPVAENHEPMVSLKKSGVKFTLLDGLIPPSTGDDIFVRAGVSEKLKKAQLMIADLIDGCVLDIVYGYRSLAVQKNSYEEFRHIISNQPNPPTSEDELNEAIHRLVAVPEVAGHPTGGAVDVRIIDKDGKELDMGTPAHNFEKESYTFNPFLSKQVWDNRQKLRQTMLGLGFAPFDGEWWHFSYGDREWATYYKKPYAIYDQIDLDSVLK
ncbi:M15 family metallopeptidase [Bacteroides sp.]|uniref:M15 family metallopeptidase n=1 Tax=Bacteroides sp. TaxID=29523 RepID=UPI00263A0E8E|nr:M15 family metallopeptidase [Bacteroides sp.]MDD3040663.1 M15 family metallopeptidase [Bacteroides sp.]